MSRRPSTATLAHLGIPRLDLDGWALHVDGLVPDTSAWSAVLDSLAWLLDGSGERPCPVPSQRFQVGFTLSSAAPVHGRDRRAPPGSLAEIVTFAEATATLARCTLLYR